MREFDNIPQTKAIVFNRQFTIAEQEEFEYEHWVNKTAKLINRPYFQVHLMVTKWPLEKIIRHYNIATKHNGQIPEDIKWWSIRKREKGLS